jgi:outer membrane lipoprotein SlyB
MRRSVLLVATMALILLAGCSGETAGSGEAKADSAAPPKANEDHATTIEGREVQIKMVANDSGRSLQIDKAVSSGHGDIICDAEIETGKIRSCAYTPIEGFSGKDEFAYVVKDASGKTDSAMVYVRVKPAN